MVQIFKTTDNVYIIMWRITLETTRYQTIQAKDTQCVRKHIARLLKKHGDSIRPIIDMTNDHTLDITDI